MALCEAVIDFSEDGSMDDEEIWNQVIAHLELFKSTIIGHLSHSKRREKISAGITVSLYGSPNVGKSTLLNHLVNREAAIVSPYPGTTRDIIQVSIDFHGFPILLSDTAGIRNSADPVEELGIARAKENVRKADVRLLLVSATNQDSLLVVEEEESEAPPPTMILVTKTDLIDQSHSSDQLDQLVQNLKRRFPDVPIHPISVLHNNLHGMSQFLQSLENHLRSLYGSEGISEQRSFQLTTYQTIHLEKILGHIEAFLGRLKTHLGSSCDGQQRQDEGEDVDLVILIEELRLASGLLAKLSFSSPASSSETSSLTHPHYHPNEISTDEILGEIFQSFCIGK